MRKPAVAGSFYSGSSIGLRQQIEDCFTHRLGPGALPSLVADTEPRSILGLVSPHAGYVYSGPVAAHGFFRLAAEEKPSVVVILGPNHRGLGSGLAVSPDSDWQTPLGSIAIDREVAEAIVSTCSRAEWDDLAHRLEHSLEVQLPFLQYIYGTGFRIVPVSMLPQSLQTSRELGNAIASALEGKNGLIIASSDFTHYESRSVAKKQDDLALKAILAMDVEQLDNVVLGYHITMCGLGPIMTMLTACKIQGARKANLLKYASSGDITHDYSQVVAYASVAVTTGKV